MENFKHYVKFGVCFAVTFGILFLIGYWQLAGPMDTQLNQNFIVLPNMDTSPPSTTNDFVEQPLTIITNPGRLGNQMFTYATLYALADLNNRTMLAMPENCVSLIKYFDMQCDIVDMRTFKESRPHFIANWLRIRDRHIAKDSNIVKGTEYPTSFTFFHHMRPKIKKLFKFKEEFDMHAKEALRRVKKMLPTTEVFVGVHVRRGDFVKKASDGWLQAFQGREVDIPYFQKAVQHFREQFKNVIFLAVSDDRDWCRRHLTDLGILTMPDSPGPGHDLAFLAQCNHTIMTYGTYGFWGGYLAGGRVVYYTNFFRPSNFTRSYYRIEKMYPPDWFGISTTEPGYWTAPSIRELQFEMSNLNVI